MDDLLVVLVGVGDLLVGRVGVFPGGEEDADHILKHYVGEGNPVLLDEQIALLLHNKSLAIRQVLSVLKKALLRKSLMVPPTRSRALRKRKFLGKSLIGSCSHTKLEREIMLSSLSEAMLALL